jgi:hypothetical protein
MGRYSLLLIVGLMMVVPTTASFAQSLQSCSQLKAAERQLERDFHPPRSCARRAGNSWPSQP